MSSGSRLAGSSVYSVCKYALAFVWIWEGAVPKIAFTSEAEIALVERVGIAAWWDAAAFIAFLGVCEILLGVVIALGRFPRVTAVISAAAISLFILVLPWYDASLLYHPFGALSKNAGLLACSFVIYKLAPHRGGKS